ERQAYQDTSLGIEHRAAGFHTQRSTPQLRVAEHVAHDGERTTADDLFAEANVRIVFKLILQSLQGQVHDLILVGMIRTSSQGWAEGGRRYEYLLGRQVRRSTYR